MPLLTRKIAYREFGVLTSGLSVMRTKSVNPLPSADR
jgi:hypothetical protein